MLRCAVCASVESFLLSCFFYHVLPTKQSTNFSTRVNTRPVVRIFHVRWVPRGVALALALALLLSGNERGYVAASTFLWFGSVRFVS